MNEDYRNISNDWKMGLAIVATYLTVVIGLAILTAH